MPSRTNCQQVTELDVAVVIEEGPVRAWISRAIDLLATIDGVTVTCLVVTGVDRPGPKPTRLHRFLDRLDQRVFSGADPDARQWVEIDASHEVLRCQVGEKGVELADDSSTCRFVYVFNLTCRALGKELASITEKGIAEIRWGPRLGATAETEIAYCVAAGDATIDCHLVVGATAHGQSPRAVFSSKSALHAYSAYRSINPVLWKVAGFPRNVVKRVAAAESGPGESYTVEVTDLPQPPEPALGNRLVIKGFARSFLRYLRTKLGLGEPRYQWQLVIRNENADRKLVRAQIDGHTAADPFLFANEGETDVFFELMPIGRGKADIAFSRLLADGSLSDPVIVLSRPYHLSYPQVFRWQDEIYMIPETRGSKAIELYRANRYPEEWQFDRYLMQGLNAVDSTLLVRDGKLWLLSCIGPDGGSTRDELHLFYTDSLHSEWTPHPLNPVVSDVSTARPAGNLFEHKGRLIRPGQDNSIRYGYAVVFSEIERMTETEYSEKRLVDVRPDGLDMALAIHTFNQAADVAIYDLAMPASSTAGLDTAFTIESFPQASRYFDLDELLA